MREERAVSPVPDPGRPGLPRYAGSIQRTVRGANSRPPGGVIQALSPEDSIKFFEENRGKLPISDEDAKWLYRTSEKAKRHAKLGRYASSTEQLMTLIGKMKIRDLNALITHVEQANPAPSYGSLWAKEYYTQMDQIFELLFKMAEGGVGKDDLIKFYEGEIKPKGIAKVIGEVKAREEAERKAAEEKEALAKKAAEDAKRALETAAQLKRVESKIGAQSLDTVRMIIAPADNYLAELIIDVADSPLLLNPEELKEMINNISKKIKKNEISSLKGYQHELLYAKRKLDKRHMVQLGAMSLEEAYKRAVIVGAENKIAVSQNMAALTEALPAKTQFGADTVDWSSGRLVQHKTSGTGTIHSNEYGVHSLSAVVAKALKQIQGQTGSGERYLPGGVRKEVKIRLTNSKFDGGKSNLIDELLGYQEPVPNVTVKIETNTDVYRYTAVFNKTGGRWVSEEKKKKIEG
jgi:hypothetical protein